MKLFLFFGIFEPYSYKIVLIKEQELFCGKTDNDNKVILVQIFFLYETVKASV